MSDTTPDLAQRLIEAAAFGADSAGQSLREPEARAIVVAVLRELVERPRHGGPHMYCRSEGELRGLIDEIEGANRNEARRDQAETDDAYEDAQGQINDMYQWLAKRRHKINKDASLRRNVASYFHAAASERGECRD